MSKKPKKEKKEKKGKNAPEAEEPRKRAVPVVPKEREPLRTFFTILLVLVGIGELALLGYLGLCIRQGIQNRSQYTARPSQTSAGSAGRSGPGSYSGPWLIEENGVKTWEWDEGRPTGLQHASGEPLEDAGPAGDGEEKRLSRLYAVQFLYELAEMDEPEEESRPLRPGEESSLPQSGEEDQQALPLRS